LKFDNKIYITLD